MPYNNFPEQIQVTLGPIWTGRNGLEAGDVIVLTKVSGSNRWTEDGTNAANETTNRISFRPYIYLAYAHTSIRADVIVADFDLASNYAGGWHNVGDCWHGPGDNQYDFLEVWENGTDNRFDDGYPDFFTMSSATYQDVFSSIQAYSDDETYDETASGGIATNGTASITTVVTAEITGGIELSGEATSDVDSIENFGISAGGTAWFFLGIETSCPCHSIYAEMSGGIEVNGSASTTSNEVKGGLLAGGNSFIDTNHVFSGIHGIWPLGGAYDGTENEVTDLSPNAFHGFCGDGNSNYVPELSEDGLYCSDSSLFDGVEYINLPQDRLNESQEFSVSCWIKLNPEHFYSPRVVFSRGFTTGDGDEWIFTLGYSHIHHVWAQIQLVGDEITLHEAFTIERIQRNRWNHMAASWKPNGFLRVFLNGVEGGSVETPELSTIDYTNGNQIGSWNRGAIPRGNLQEIRLYPEEKTANWWKAEYDNACKPGFYLVGKSQSAVLV